MELDFDKEIDALLRKVRPGDTAGLNSAHLDTDEIAAFAENAVPDATRRLYIDHLADCDRCRTVLSHTVSLRPEAATSAASSSVESTAVLVPWYRRLFSAPSLAYTMGVLVLLFSGLLGYLLLQRTPPSGTGEISQVSDKETAASANYAAPSISVTANSNAVPANPSVNATGTVANTTAQKPGLQPSPPAAGVAAGEAPAKSDNAAVGGNAGAPPPPPPADAAVTAAEQPKPAIVDKTEEEKAKDRITAESQTLSEQAKKRSTNRLMKELPPAIAPPAAAAPSREGEIMPRSDTRGYDVSGVRRVSGRTFERKDGVWYDSAYHGQSATGVRRGTEAYLRLDSGLRSIADALPGTVVAVWNGKAYRIQ